MTASEITTNLDITISNVPVTILVRSCLLMTYYGHLVSTTQFTDTSEGDTATDSRDVGENLLHLLTVILRFNKTVRTKENISIEAGFLVKSNPPPHKNITSKL